MKSFNKYSLLLFFLFFIAVPNSILFAQDDYCRWGTCSWGNDCMEGPSHIFGDYHPGCKSEWIKNNPEKWAEMQRKEAAMTFAVLGFIASAIKKDADKDRKEREAIERAETAKKVEYVRSRVSEHLEYRKRLLDIYDNPETKRNFVVKYILLNNIKLTAAAVEEFSEFENLINNVQNTNQRKIYEGNGSHINNLTQLPSEYLFFPDGNMPSLDLNEIGSIIDLHLANIDLLEKAFNSDPDSKFTFIKKFQLFKNFDLPITKMSQVNSYSDFIRIFNEVKSKSILNFKNPDSPYVQQYETVLLTEEYLPQVFIKDALLIDESIVTYFLGPGTFNRSLPLKYIEKKVVENISDYLDVFGKEIKTLDPKMKNILRLEDTFFSGRYQSGGIKSRTPEKWNYTNSLISPYNRYLLVKDFAIVYNYLIKRPLTAIENNDFLTQEQARKERVRRENGIWPKFQELKLSFTEYLKDEPFYLEQLFSNIDSGYVDLDSQSGYLVFSKRRYRDRYQGEYIDSGTPIYRVLDSHNYYEGKSYVNNNKILSFEDDILKGQNEIKAKYDEAEKIFRTRSNFNFKF